MDLFFYGTLMDADVRGLVLGPKATGLRLEPARLHGFRRMAKRHSTAPVIVPRPGVWLPGLLARGLRAGQILRLRHFEGRNYRLCACRVRLGSGEIQPAMVYRGAGHIPVRRMEWRLASWQRRHKRGFLRRMAPWIAVYREARYSGRGRPRWITR
ncbi:MAG TPA: gamma-glutamylcyclotransferase family protein [Alphaproteobacteria bacterium]|nr:gamma-glutamylcyclotransferase family protein [Alphaproteobacteria bacterium]